LTHKRVQQEAFNTYSWQSVAIISKWDGLESFYLESDGL